MGYRIVLIKNGAYKHTLYKCQKEETAYVNYRSIKKMNENILFPRKFINNNGIKEVDYKVYLVKDIEDGDINRVVRDNKGKFFEEKPLDDKWTILETSNYNIEENFWVYGYNPKSKSNRLNITDVIKLLMKGAYKRKMVKSIIVVNNKLVIYNEDTFEMVICKNKLDAQRLHHTLHKANNKGKLKSLLFLGTATPASISLMYELIHERTGWKMTKIRRTTTRP